MKIDQTATQLENLYNDWFGLVANRRFCRKENTITWTGYRAQFVHEPVTYGALLDLSEDRQYSFQYLEDGSLFQLYYEFDAEGEKAVAARLAFYKSPVSSREEPNYEGIETSDEEVVSEEEELRGLLVPWLRLDYSVTHAKGVLHHECHLHLSGFEGGRLVVAGVPGPRQFVEFVVALCYPMDYEIHRLDKEGNYANEKILSKVNVPCVPPVHNRMFNQIAHLRIPGTPISPPVARASRSIKRTRKRWR